jgi:serine/threonine protein phosphatase 1
MRTCSEMSLMRTLAVGDIHGADIALKCLLEAVRQQPSDQIIFLGDYVDRGPGSREVIDTLLGLEKVCLPIFLRGNHEIMFMDSRADPLDAREWKLYGGLETLSSYGCQHRDDWPAGIPEFHWRFIESTRSYFETPTHIFVHAAVDPEMEMSEQPDWLLFWEFFGRQQPHKSGKRIICGHSLQRSGEINDVGFATCIDTGAAMAGWLTCLDADSGQYWQGNEQGETRSGMLPT